MESVKKVLYIDPVDLHLDEENVFGIHPAKLSWLSSFNKDTFDSAVIQNVPVSTLNSLAFFQMGQALKVNSVVDVYVDQPISVMQSLDAGEIEANAKLAGFSDFQQSDYEKWVKKDGKDFKFSTIKISMIRPAKVKNSTDNTKKK
jgi:hypothetical protein